MTELVLGVLLAAAALWFVLGPIFRPYAASARAAAEWEDLDEDLSPQAVALRALKEIEFDRATGKLSDADYDALHRKYTAEAIAAMKGEGTKAAPAATRAPPPSPVPRLSCPTHGPRPEPDAEFCSECGRRLGGGEHPGYCARCGTGLEAEARYCRACGARVAA